MSFWRGRVGALAAVSSQGVVAAGSLGVQLLAARTLGANGFASFALVYATLVVVTALHTAWVGDALTVLDRFDPRTRSGLQTSVLLGLAMGAVAGLVAALLADEPLRVALVCAGLFPAWLVQETLRRVLTTTEQFPLLAATDGLAAVVQVGIAAAALATGTASLTIFLTGLLVASLVSAAVIAARVDRRELARARRHRGGLRTVASFSVWRSLQASLRPLPQLVLRVLVVAVGGRTALAGVEAARLLVAPAQTLVNGAGAFLLPTLTRAARLGDETAERTALRWAVGLVTTTVLLAAAGAALAPTLGPVISGGDFPVPVVAVVAWGVYMLTHSATLPLSTLAVTGGDSRPVFLVRLAGASTGVVLVAALLLAGGAPSLAPAALGLGGLVDVALLVRLVRRRRRTLRPA